MQNVLNYLTLGISYLFSCSVALGKVWQTW